MTDIKLTINDDGTGTLSNNYGDVVDIGRMFGCDACQQEHPFTELFEVMAPRPSTGEMVAVMWIGAQCPEGKSMRGE